MKQLRKVLILIHNTFLTPPPRNLFVPCFYCVQQGSLSFFFVNIIFFLAFLNLDFVKNVNMFFSTLISRSTRIWKTKLWWNLIILCGFLHEMRFFLHVYALVLFLERKRICLRMSSVITISSNISHVFINTNDATK